MAVKKPKTAKKPSFDIGDILKFVQNQAIGPKAEGLWKEAGNIPMPSVGDMLSGGGQKLQGISPTALALGAKAGKAVEGLANTGVGQWVGADAAYKTANLNQNPKDFSNNLANLLFSIMPLGAGKGLKKAKNAALAYGVGTEDMRMLMKLLLGTQNK